MLIKRRWFLNHLFFFDLQICTFVATDFTMIKDFLNSRALKIMGNKYFIASLVFAVWILFFDENSISRHLKDRRQLSELVQQKAYYKERIEIDKQKYRELHQGNAELEKFAREQYYMSKPDEDIFIIEAPND